MTETTVQRIARQILAASELFALAHGSAPTLEAVGRAFDALTEPTEIESGALRQILDALPPATFDCDWLPLQVIHSDPRQN